MAPADRRKLIRTGIYFAYFVIGEAIMINLHDFRFVGPVASADSDALEALNAHTVSPEHLWSHLIGGAFEITDDVVLQQLIGELVRPLTEYSDREFTALDVRVGCTLALGHRLKADRIAFNRRELMAWGASAPVIIQPSPREPNGHYVLDYNAVTDLVRQRDDAAAVST